MCYTNLTFPLAIPQQAEIERSEFIAGVPGLLAKIRTLRPRVVCFVGMDIADTFRTVLLEGQDPLILPIRIAKPGTDALGETLPKQHVPANRKARVKLVTKSTLQAQERAAKNAQARRS